MDKTATTPTCVQGDCRHSWEEHADAWFVSGALLSNIRNMTPPAWSELVIGRGDAWILTPDMDSAFKQFKYLSTLISVSDESEGVMPYDALI